MLKELTPLASHSNGVDCRHLSVFNLLNYKQYSHFESVWKQCGLFYTKPTDDAPGLLRSKYLNIEEEMHLVHNIDAFSLKTIDSQGFINDCLKSIKHNDPIIVYVDTYYLKGNFYFQKKHMLHTVILADVEDDIFTLVDDTFYQIYQLEKTDFLKTANIKRDDKYVYNYLTFSLKNAKDILETKDFLKVINQNKIYLSGDLKEEQLQKLSNLHRDYPVKITGMNAITQFVKDYKYFETEQEISQEIYYSLYLSLMELANYHYRYFSFLKFCKLKDPDIDELLDLLEDMSQEWRVSSNMMLKAMYKNDLNLFKRMLRKVENIKMNLQLTLERSAIILCKYKYQGDFQYVD